MVGTHTHPLLELGWSQMEEWFQAGMTLAGGSSPGCWPTKKKILISLMGKLPLVELV